MRPISNQAVCNLEVKSCCIKFWSFLIRCFRWAQLYTVKKVSIYYVREICNVVWENPKDQLDQDSVSQSALERLDSLRRLTYFFTKMRWLQAKHTSMMEIALQVIWMTLSTIKQKNLRTVGYCRGHHHAHNCPIFWCSIDIHPKISVSKRF